VCGDAALYADPDDVVSWAQAVRRLRDDPGLRRRTARAGRTQARRYTWRGIAETYLDLMMEIDGASATRKW
jgi:glycosyltransferase involved in cell wall biosynthesis